MYFLQFSVLRHNVKALLIDLMKVLMISGPKLSASSSFNCFRLATSNHSPGFIHSVGTHVEYPCNRTNMYFFKYHLKIKPYVLTIVNKESTFKSWMPALAGFTFVTELYREVYLSTFNHILRHIQGTFHYFHSAPLEHFITVLPFEELPWVNLSPLNSSLWGFIISPAKKVMSMATHPSI